MLLLSLGAIFIVIGALSLRFVVLCELLKNQDQAQWKILGSPGGYSFTDMGKTIGMYSWILAQGYEQSASAEVISEGKKALKKALFARYLMIAGIVFVMGGVAMIAMTGRAS